MTERGKEASDLLDKIEASLRDRKTDNQDCDDESHNYDSAASAIFVVYEATHKFICRNPAQARSGETHMREPFSEFT